MNWSILSHQRLCAAEKDSMAAADKNRFLCQMCGKLTDAGSARCRNCGGNPVVQSGCSVSPCGPANGYAARSDSGQNGSAEYEALRDQMDLLIRGNREMGFAVSALEKELVAAKAGLETLLGELCSGKLVVRARFIGKWAAQAKKDFKGMKLKEICARKKWEFLGKCPERKMRAMESMLAGAEKWFSAMEWDNAYSALRSAEALVPKNYPLTSFMARFALDMEKYSDAATYVGRSLEEKPLPIETLKLAALSYFLSGNESGAQACADRWIREAGENYEPLLLKAYIKAASGRWDEARRCSELAMSREEGLIPQLILAFSLIRQEKKRTARKVLDKASRDYPESPEVKHMQHALFLLSGSRKEAVSVRSSLVEAVDVRLCRKREKLLDANKIESFFETVKPDMEMVMRDLNAGTLTSA